MNRRRPKVVPKLSLWKEEAGFFTCQREDLEAALIAEGQTQEEMSSRMGHGFHLVALALEGHRLTQYEVQMVEHGIMAPRPVKPSHSTPDPQAGMRS